MKSKLEKDTFALETDIVELHTQVLVEADIETPGLFDVFWSAYAVFCYRAAKDFQDLGAMDELPSLAGLTIHSTYFSL